MKDDTMLLLNMINEGRTLNEMSKVLGLSNKQLFMRLSMLRNSGYLFDRHYHYNGDISYSISDPLVQNNSNTININTSNDLKTIRAVLTSDTHLGHIEDRLECIDSMTDYCIREGINLVFNAGDFFDGIHNNGVDSKFQDPFQQIAYGLKNYPYDKNILTMALLGNHDATFWLEYGIDIKNILLDRRQDIIPVGYGYGKVNIGGFQVKMRHPIRSNGIKVNAPDEQLRGVLLRGHSHEFRVVPSSNSLIIYVPALSGVLVNGNLKKMLPGMIDMKLEIKNDVVYSEYFQQFVFINNEPVKVGEIQYYIPIKLKKDKCIQTNIVPKIGKNLLNSREDNFGNYVQQVITDFVKIGKDGVSNSDGYYGIGQMNEFEGAVQKVKK